MSYIKLFLIFFLSTFSGVLIGYIPCEYPIKLETLKTFFDIVFSLVTSTIAILTFKAAKETFFQPIRSEVAKKQTELLSDLLLTLQQELNSELDYIQLSHLNAQFWLLKYGFIFQNHEEVKRNIKENVCGSQMFPDETGKVNGTIVEAFENAKNDPVNESKVMYEKAKKGDIKISEVVFTKKHMEIVIKLDRFAHNPFIPSKISQQLKQLIKQIQINRSIHLRSTVSWVIGEVIQRKNKTSITFNGVFNEFNHRRVHHNEIIESIKAEIRLYLQIDSVPWIQ